MPLDQEQTQQVLDRLSDELERAAQADRPSGPLRDPLKIERYAQRVKVSRFYTVEISVSGEKERVETTFVTGVGQRPETRIDPIPSDTSGYRTLAGELIQPFLHGRG